MKGRARPRAGATIDLEHAHVGGQAVDCGHFLAEEQPAQVAARLGEWLAA